MDIACSKGRPPESPRALRAGIMADRGKNERQSRARIGEDRLRACSITRSSGVPVANHVFGLAFPTRSRAKEPV